MNRTGAIIVVATVRIHPDKAAKYEETCARLMPQVRAGNPGVLFYDAGKSRDEADCYRVIEVYRDQAAMDEHIGSRFVAESMADLQDCIADLRIDLHDSIT